ncbi:septum formation protein Maf [bacterium]|nr:septum formation protein Maf [bacterium]
MRKIILASASPRRKQLLEELNVDFTVHKSDVEEIMDSTMHPSKLAMENAYRKALDISKEYTGQDCVTIGSDTVVVHNGKIMGKPTDEDDAFKMLSQLSNHTHQVYSGIAIVDCLDSNYVIDYAVTDVTMWDFDEEIIRIYIATGEPLDKAGSYGIQGKGRLLVKRINGCYFNVVGLPITLLAKSLLNFNINFFKVIS